MACGVASALPAGHRIGPGSKFGAYQTMWYFFAADGTFGPGAPLTYRTCGYWKNVKGRFLGFQFTAQGQKHFGWARLNTPAPNTMLTGYAYETEPNKPIRAGDTGPLDAVPAELAMFWKPANMLV